ncbi:methyltransferase domain-containing protein [Horticoccus luteus]|uniref:Methyltransferase domain-containing protein n=1 Tax=Horticoccus luteus TaxID=2862869 RepID=A0A8F9XKB9_9BACT|nr:class I SAM-dependent methyltransferase [Horticoccus luteus]QYM78041.1 methyltransferase domain-containing protein [Horticoccus luteus]
MNDGFLVTYPAHVARLRAKLDRDAALREAVGGNFLAMGKLECALLVQLGLTADSRVIDVGCGSGRLACQLAAVPGVRYLGTDVVEELLAYARELAQRSDWVFAVANGVKIEAPDNTADFVCFFSVLTHLKHEDSYRYLQEAKRVLKPGGAIVFSFLEFFIPSHWEVFRHMLEHGQPGDHLNQFMDREAIKRWAYYLEMDVEAVWDGDKPHIPFEGEVVLDDGRKLTGVGALGQSVAVLRKRR